MGNTSHTPRIETLILYELPKPSNRLMPHLYGYVPSTKQWFSVMKVPTCARELWLGTQEEMNAAHLHIPDIAKRTAEDGTYMSAC